MMYTICSSLKERERGLDFMQSITNSLSYKLSNRSHHLEFDQKLQFSVVTVYTFKRRRSKISKLNLRINKSANAPPSKRWEKGYADKNGVVDETETSFSKWSGRA